jgi:general stress protein YciG
MNNFTDNNEETRKEIEENENAQSGNEPKKSRRGFASMSPEQQRQIASKGGQAAHQRGVAHQWNADEARKAGKKGGEKVSQNRQHMAEIGRKGGKSSHGGGRKKANNNTDNTNTPDSNENVQPPERRGEYLD